MDFVLTQPQDPINHDLYKNLPKGIETKTVNGKANIFNNDYYSKATPYSCAMRTKTSLPDLARK